MEQEIARVRGEIEQMEAEQKNLEHRVDFATIDLKLSEEYKAKLDSPAPAISTLIHNAAVNGYRNVADTLLSIVLFFAEYAPVLFFWLLLLSIPAGSSGAAGVTRPKLSSSRSSIVRRFAAQTRSNLLR